jgi:hypothetical protein
MQITSLQQRQYILCCQSWQSSPDAVPPHARSVRGARDEIRVSTATWFADVSYGSISPFSRCPRLVRSAPNIHRASRHPGWAARCHKLPSSSPAGLSVAKKSRSTLSRKHLGFLSRSGGKRQPLSVRDVRQAVAPVNDEWENQQYYSA